ncbi:MAG: hypothetical protein WC497_01095 [Patescibacteria group bacterium]
MKRRPVIVIGKILILLVPVFLLGWVINVNVAPTGHVRIVQHVGQASRGAIELEPAARLSDIDTGSRQIIDQPVYFSMKMPRSFETAKVTLEYQNQDQPLVELGVHRTVGTYDYLLKPFDVGLLRNSEWDFLSDNTQSLLLAQRKTAMVTKYTSIQEFTKNIPRDSITAEYNIDYKKDYRLPDYQKLDTELNIATSLQGRHVFYAYIKDEPLNINVVYQDINKNVGPDRFHLNIYYGDTQRIQSVDRPDDGEEGATGGSSAEQSVAVNIPNLPEGIYRLEFDISDDLIIKKIHTTLHYLVVDQRIKVLENQNKEPVRLFSRADKYTVLPLSSAGRQSVSIDSQDIALNDSGLPAVSQTTGDQKNNLHTIVLPQGNAMLTANGAFSFTPESCFYPASFLINLADVTDFSGIDYVLTKDFTPPTTNGDWLTGSQTFDLRKAYISDRTTRFEISAPGLAQRGAVLNVRKITIDLYRQPMKWQTLLTDLKNYLKKI